MIYLSAGQQHLQQLLDRGADPNTNTLSRQTSPLLLAAGQGRPEVLQLLVENTRTRLTEVEPELSQTMLHQVFLLLYNIKNPEEFVSFLGGKKTDA